MNDRLERFERAEAAELARLAERFYRPRNTDAYPYRYVATERDEIETVVGIVEVRAGDVINPGIFVEGASYPTIRSELRAP